MMPVTISGDRSSIKVKVTKYGQMVVAPIQYSTPKTVTLDVINTAFNFITPIQGSSIVITDIIVAADKNVSPTEPAVVEVYTANSDDSMTVIDDIILTQIPRSTTVPITGLNLLVGEGVWVNAKTNDSAVTLTIMFYRIPVGDI